MNEIINKCKSLEEKPYIETKNSCNTKIYTNIGYLVTNDYEVLINICSRNFKKVFYTDTQYKDIIISNEKNIDNINLIITQPYLIHVWEKYSNDSMFIVNHSSKITDTIFKQYNMIVISHSALKKNFNIIYEHSYKRVIFHNYTNKLISNCCIDYEFKWYIYSDISLIKDCFYGNKEILNHILINDEQSKPINVINIECKRPITILTLDGLVDEVLLNNIEQNNIKHVIKHLTDSSIKTEKDIIKNVMRKFREQIKNLETHEYCIKKMYFANSVDQQNKLVRLEKKKESIREKEAELRKRITENNLCFICYSDINITSILKCCSNKVCFECINKWKKCNTNETVLCPLCKKDDFEFFVQEPTIEHNNKQEICAKNSIFENFECLIKQLNNNENKIGILGNNRTLLTRFENILERMSIKFLNFRGNNNILKRIAHHFKHDVNILLLDMSILTTGVPVEAMTDLIIITNTINPVLFNNQCKKLRTNYHLKYI